jgi:plastocyanin/DNA-binding MarR family transcriptional regulator
MGEIVAAGRWRRILAATFLSGVLVATSIRAQVASDRPPPRILLDQSPVAITYQLRRLSDDDLARVERRADDVRYVPVYYALLGRAAMSDDIRAEAVDALVSLEKTSPAAVLLDALQRATDAAVAAPLLRDLAAQPVSGLAAERERIETVLTRADATTFARQGAYLARILGDGRIDAAWDVAAGRDGHRATLVHALRFLPATAEATLRDESAARVEAVVDASANDDEAQAAIGTLAALRPDRATFNRLAGVMTRAGSPSVFAAAVDGLNRVPRSQWAPETVEPLIRGVITRLQVLSPDARAEVDAVDAAGLAERLTGVLPDERARPLRAELRALGVRVVRLETLPEQVAFDLRWFAVQAGRPVQIVFFNPDAMPHNVVIGTPGSLELLGTKGGEMPLPEDPSVKPFVPGVPEVLQATRLVAQGHTERLGFVAPASPGEYVFVCTFPGHWVRMYGVMLVVPDLAAWEAAPVVPIDPMTNQPFASQRME